jgi:hypothetical protein
VACNFAIVSVRALMEKITWASMFWDGGVGVKNKVENKRRFVEKR